MCTTLLQTLNRKTGATVSLNSIHRLCSGNVKPRLIASCRFHARLPISCHLMLSVLCSLCLSYTFFLLLYISLYSTIVDYSILFVSFLLRLPALQSVVCFSLFNDFYPFSLLITSLLHLLILIRGCLLYTSRCV